MTVLLSVGAVVAACGGTARTGAELGNDAGATLRPGARTWLHAHNCYPHAGEHADRIGQALAAPLPWVAIEQDLVWAQDASAPDSGRPVLSHEKELIGGEPSLDEHFFARVQPMLDRALAEGDRSRWPILVLHFDFKTNEPTHHRAVWDLLGRYERYLTTAVKGSDPARVEPLRPGPLLVLTESGPGQEEAFFGRLAPGQTLRLFGTVPPPDLSDGDQRRRHELDPATLVVGGPTTYRRWVNLPWDAVEQGGPASAGEWTDVESRRLRALVARAHGLGIWIRFYALNGHAPDDHSGWSSSYNVGSLDTVKLRWRAAMDAGVEFIATDQYEAFATEWAERALASRPNGAT